MEFDKLISALKECSSNLEKEYKSFDEDYRKYLINTYLYLDECISVTIKYVLGEIKLKDDN